MRLVFKFQSDSAFAEVWQHMETRDGIYEHPFGLPGTASWWEAIDSGRLPTVTIEDFVAVYKPAGANPGDGALITLRDGSQWQATDERGRAVVYHKGQRVRIRYVALQPRKTWARLIKFPLEIERDDNT
jgi:hypothetical protein